MVDLGMRIRNLRKARRQTLKQVSGDIDLSISYLSEIERNITEPSLKTLRKIAGYYKVPVVSFFD